MPLEIWAGTHFVYSTQKHVKRAEKQVKACFLFFESDIIGAFFVHCVYYKEKKECYKM